MPGGHHRIPRAEFRKFLADKRIPVTPDAPLPKPIKLSDIEAVPKLVFMQ